MYPVINQRRFELVSMGTLEEKTNGGDAGRPMNVYEDCGEESSLDVRRRPFFFDLIFEVLEGFGGLVVSIGK
ncbi:hypothetical protein I302_107518 [Kwoniella bestiolae CBS 10118]|uniref:Uncharacterized protein n=1 Tax=Kwoniella bestiolae CBS 10118 TaxID=1296100 RepID=A0AAJ8KDS9_9TREE